MNQQLTFGLVRDGKYYARLASMNKIVGKFGEQIKLTWTLFKNEGANEHAGVLDTYMNANRALFETLESMCWPEINDEGINISISGTNIITPSEVAAATYHVEVVTFVTKTGTEKQSVTVLGVVKPDKANGKANGKPKGGKRP